MSQSQNYRHRAPLTAPESGRANRTVERSGKTIGEFVDAYTPSNLTSEVWDEISDFVRGCITDLNFPPDTSIDHLRHHLSALSYLAAWTRLTYPLNRQSVLDHKVIDAYHSHSTHEISPATASGRRRILMWIGRRLNPAWMGSTRFQKAPEPVPQPYRSDELKSFNWWHKSQPSDERRREVGTVMSLALGAGLRATEIGSLRRGAVEMGSGCVIVRPSGFRSAPPRESVLRAEWEDHLLAVISELEADDYVFMLERPTKRSGLAGDYLRRTSGTDLPSPNVQRLRATWIVRQIMAGVPSDVICAAAGLESLNRYGEWVTKAGANRTDIYRSMLRGKREALDVDHRKDRRPALHVVPNRG